MADARLARSGLAHLDFFQHHDVGGAGGVHANGVRP
jgi:hypothetical protein